MVEPVDRDATPESMAQTTPSVADLMREADTRSMVHELGISVGALTETIRLMNARADNDSRKLDGLSRDNLDIVERLKTIEPKVDDVLGFLKHGMPNLATKADIATVQGDIKAEGVQLRNDIKGVKDEVDKRPTRWKLVLDVALVVGLIAGLMAIAGHLSSAR